MKLETAITLYGYGTPEGAQKGCETKKSQGQVRDCGGGSPNGQGDLKKVRSLRDALERSPEDQTKQNAVRDYLTRFFEWAEEKAPKSQPAQRALVRARQFWARQNLLSAIKNVAVSLSKWNAPDRPKWATILGKSGRKKG